MALHTFVATAAGTGGVLLAMTGLWLILRPRRLWQRWYALERSWRSHRFGGRWTPLERALRRRAYFWIPRDVELHRPEDVYSYALSDRFWGSKYAWFVRLLCWYAGALLIFFGFAILALGLPNLP